MIVYNNIKSLYIEKYNLFIFIFLLLFSNLFSRIFDFEFFNWLFYLVGVILISIKLLNFKITYFKLYLYNLCLFYIIYCIFDLRSSEFNSNLLAIKDFCFPILCLLIGENISKNRNNTINLLNHLFLYFVLYGIIQEIAFYTNNLETWLPWDYKIINDFFESGEIGNLFQGSLLRFFGPMNAFVEYQVYVVSISLVLILYNRYLHNGFIFKINIILGIIFLILSIERSPIIMLLIWVTIWKIPVILNNFGKLIKLFIILTLISIIAFGFYDNLSKDETVGIGVQRLVNILTLNLANDEAVVDREDNQWKIAWELSKNNYFGIGPGTVAPAANKYNGYIAPHNNFLVFHLAFGFLGVILFILFLLLIVAKISKLNRNFQLFGYGMICAFIGMAFFNLPFCGRNGTIFFILIGLLINSVNPEKKYGSLPRY